MGLEIKRNKKGQYQLISTISGELHHPEKKWITEDEAKKVLIIKEFWKFVDKTLEIDMSFPNKYRVNDAYQFDNSKPDFHRWWSENAAKEDFDEVLTEKFEEILTRLGIEIDLNTTKK